MFFFEESFTREQLPCKLCEVLNSGICENRTNDTCRCFSGFNGLYCSEKAATTIEKSSFTQWPIVVGVVSAVAGLLLIISVATCAYTIRKKRYQRSPIR